MIVCICSNTSEEELKTYIKENECKYLKDVQQELPVCLGCCTCKQEVLDLIEEYGNI